jgi:hypothetical protein
MKVWPKILAGLIVLFLSGVAVIVVGAYFLLKGMCGTEVYQTLYSPDKAFKAVVYQFDCGATTSFSTQVSLLKADAVIENEAGNVFSAKGHPKDAALEVKWVDSHHLSIDTPSNIEVYKRENEWGWFSDSVEVTYP